MKKKQQHIEQQNHYPLEHLYTEPFWTYVPFTHNDLHIVDNWIEHNKKEMTALLNNGNFLENVKHFHHVFGAQMHPVLNQSFEALMEGIDSFHYFHFHKIKVDCFTLKIINTFAHQLNLQVIVLKNNLFEPQDLLYIFQLLSNKDTKLFKVYIQGNPIDHITYDPYKDHHQNKHLVLQNPKEFYIKLPTITYLEFLILKENQLNDEFLEQFVQEFRHNQPNNLKHLDLSNNPITSKGLDAITELLSNYNQLVYLGLAGLNISKFGDVKKLLHCVGRHKISQDEAQKLQELEQEREAQIQKLQKARKKYSEDQLPYLPKLSTQDGYFFTYHNPLLQYLNLSENNFGEIDKDGFEKFLHLQQDPFVLIIENNNFEEAQKQRFKKKYKKCVIV